MERLLTVTPRLPGRRALFALTTGAAGYTMGWAAFAFIFGPHGKALQGGGEASLPPVVAMVPGLLCVGVGLAASGSRSVKSGASVAFGSAVGLSLLCPPLTFLWLTLVYEPSWFRGDEGVALMLVSIFGQLIAIPLGVAFGLVFAAQAAALRAVLDRPARAGRAAVLVTIGLGWMAVGAVSLQAGWPLFALGAVATAAGALGYGRRRRLVRRARAGTLTGWAVVPAAEAPDVKALPRLFPFGEAADVLVRRAHAAQGPFRAGDVSEPVARV